MQRPWQRIWGGAADLIASTHRRRWADLFLLAGLLGVVLGVLSLGRQWTGAIRPTVEIDLSFTALPRYMLFSLGRGLVAYCISLALALGFGYWAAKDRLAGRVILPLFDILQSVPVLAFMPGLVLALIVLFPNSNLGLELASIGMIVSGQAWNLFFSFVHSLRTVPPGLEEAARAYRFGAWQRFARLEMPCAAMGLAWNSMLSMAGGWFFLIVCEAFTLGDRDFRLPGLGAYMSVAIARDDTHAMLGAIGAMIAIIILLDQVLWRPVVVWAQKFRIEESATTQEVSSWFLTWMRRSGLLGWMGEWRRRRARRAAATPLRPPPPPHPPSHAARAVPRLLFALLVLSLCAGVVRMFALLRDVPSADWLAVMEAGGFSLLRVLAASALGTLWALPVGLLIGLSPRIARICQPVVQVLAAFPTPMLFPLLVVWLGVPLGWSSILLLAIGTQWYILFNVIAGAMSVPADLRELARGYQFSRLLRLKRLYLPAVFPFLVTGWVTATGGAWNATIVAEYVRAGNGVRRTRGLGALISEAAAEADFPLLAAGVLVMAALVVLFNRTVWRYCYRIAEERYAPSA
ncbi:MAG: ABC transporter permease subunit [Planctomycetaceae bacterium]